MQSQGKKVFSDYFARLQEQLTASSSLAGLAPQSGESGKNREILVALTLKAHLPPRVEIVQGGLLTDASGALSNQIDVLVCNQFAFRGAALPLGVVPVEALVAAIEVKSSQKKATMQKLFEQTECIKQLTKDPSTSVYDGVFNDRRRTRKPLVIGWFWQTAPPRQTHFS